MKIVIVTSGSRGDVQPYVMLGLELQQRGHEVVLATEQRMEQLVKQLGQGRLRFFKISGDPTLMIYGKKNQELLAKGSIMKVLQMAEAHNKGFAEQVLADTAAACEGAGLVLSGMLSLTASMSAAQKLGVPWVPVCLGPVMPTAEFPSWAISSSPFRWKWLNRASYSFIFWAIWQQEAARINAWRSSSLGLPPLKQGPASVLASAHTAGVDIPVIMMCSSHVVPGLKAPADWPANCHLTGFPFSPAVAAEADVELRLREFVLRGASAGDEQQQQQQQQGGEASAPLYLGFGSMPAPDPKALLELAVQVVTLTQRRAVLVAGWSELESILSEVQLPPELLIVQHAPHDWLLPRCCAAVHHCGVGTCGAVLRAGIPSVPCPVMLDQPFQAARLVEAGVACKPLPFRQISAEALVGRIKAVLADSAMAARAAAVARQVAGYPGVAAAADVALAAASPWQALQGKL
ncbi:hypothetical protein OEZ85_009790 [Tetradesmus obliquus]|uniref:Glycosyltransferase family 28 N-terminal domain-containing protein n=1 Tax=Tetradesmus obliquus TaxID=3088 RepID=A0ABY8UAB5_TETOB|nr:hypothetical protein OEZ85_009790 [Tetradesmus obliquus]